MGQNFKSHRVQACRDRLHLKGRYELTFRQKVDAILELLFLCYSPRSLMWCRKYVAEIRDRYKEMSPEELQVMAVLEDRLEKKRETIVNRQAKKGSSKRDSPKPTPAPPAPAAPAPGERDIWDL